MAISWCKMYPVQFWKSSQSLIVSAPFKNLKSKVSSEIWGHLSIKSKSKIKKNYILLTYSGTEYTFTFEKEREKWTTTRKDEIKGRWNRVRDGASCTSRTGLWDSWWNHFSSKWLREPCCQLCCWSTHSLSQDGFSLCLSLFVCEHPAGCKLSNSSPLKLRGHLYHFSSDLSIL